MDQAPAPWRVIDPQPATPRNPGSESPAQTPLVGGPLPIAVALVGVVLALTVVAVGVVVAPTSEASLTIETPETPAAAVSTAPDGPVVEVAGAVARPGLYRLPADSRVADAIAAAGGFGPRVDSAAAERSLNLAARLRDGDEIRVPSRDDPPEAGPAKSGDGPGGASGLLDINTASAGELEALPGIGPATAAKIIAARDERPFSSVDELRGRRLVGEATFAKVRDMITVR